MTALDDVLPRWHHRERHGVPGGSRILAALEALTWREVPLFAILMSIRALGRRGGTLDSRILADFESMGFRPVARTDDEIVYAGIGRPWSPRGGTIPVPSAAGFRDFAEPGWAKMAVNFRVADGALTTETRVWLTDAAAHRRFAAYWLFIRPFSGLIRRRWLVAAARRAEVVHTS